MKPFEKQIQTFLCIVLWVGFLVANGDCLAQTQTSKAKATFSRRGEPTLNDKKLDVDFMDKPMSAENFFGRLRRKFEEISDEPLNIVFNENGRTAMIPRIELKQVRISSVLDAVNLATQQELRCDLAGDRVITVQSRSRSKSKPAKTSVQVFNVAFIVDQNDEAKTTLLSAIEIGLALAESSMDEVSLKFHKQTNLLFIRGSETDIDIVAQVIEQIAAGMPEPENDGASEGLLDGMDKMELPLSP